MRKSFLGRVVLVATACLNGITALGQIDVGPGESLSVTSSTTENFLLNGGTLEPTNVTLSGSIELRDDSHIVRPQNAQILDGRGNPFEPSIGSTMLTGPISGTGDLEIGNLSRDQILISGDSVYDGHTYITSGTVRVDSVNALGSIVSGTTIQGGLLDIRVPTQEPFRVEGGRLEFNASGFEPNGPLTIAGGEVVLRNGDAYSVPIIVDGEEGEVNFGSSQFVPWIGGSIGVGNLRISGRTSIDGPLTHQGDVTVNGAILNAVNSYTGKTFLADDYTIDRGDVFGNSTTPIEILGGDVVATVLPNGNRGFALRQGSLRIQIGNAPISAPIVLGGANPVLTGDNTYDGPVELDGGISGRATIRGGVFNGVISGSARRLTLIGDTPIQLNADNTYEALTLSGHEGPVEVNSPRALGGAERGTRVSVGEFRLNAITDEPVVITGRGSLFLNAQQARFPRFGDLDTGELDRRHTVEVNVASSYDESVDVAEGTLQVNDNLSFRKLTITKNGAVRIAAGKSLDLGSSDVMFHEGLIDGRVRGTGTLRKTTTARGEAQHLSDFDGDIVIERGALEAFSTDALGTTASATYVAEKDAVLRLRASGFDPPLVIHEDIFLNNATGVDHTGGLYLSRLCCNTPTIRLTGQLDLGSVGSIVGTASSSSTADNVNLEVTGPVSGGSLTTLGRRLRLKLLGSNQTYTGATNIREGTIELAGNATLQSTEVIVLYEGPEFFDGTLLLNNSESSLQDRVANDTPIEFRGGKLTATGDTMETLGLVDFIEGNSEIDLEASFNANESSRQLHAINVHRQPGATAHVDLASNANFRIANVPAAAGGIFPWLLVTDRRGSSGRVTGFGTYTERGVVPINDYQSNFDIAGPTSNMLVTSPIVLTNNTRINSISAGNSSADLDLNGNRLTVESGGILFNSFGGIANGSLTAGPAGNYELVIPFGARIAADVVDNGGNAVSLTVTGSLSGNNTYSGTTYVNEGGASFLSETALPDDADLQIVGGEVQIDYVATAPKHLDHVRISGDGEFEGGNGIFSFDQIVLEDGDFRGGQLVGTGEIMKRTIGPASIAADPRSTYSGNVVVEEGRLTSSGLLMATYTVRGGSLDLRGGDNAIVMDGGTLYLSAGLGGDIELLSPSTISTESSADTRYRVTHSGQLSGPGALSLTGEVRFRKIRHQVSFSNNSPSYTGDVTIDSILVAADQQQSLGTGKITILPGGKLRFGGRSISSEPPSFDFSNDIDLLGGELFGTDNDRQPRQLLGSLRVSGHSMIGEMNVAGTTYLEDGARLTTFREGVLRFFGDIKVGGKTELEYGLQEIVTNSAGTNGGVVQLLGTITTDAEESVLNFIDRGMDEIVLDASYHVATGQTLQLRKDGQPFELNVDGSSNFITGGGTLLNPVEFGDGAVIRPGDSPGILSLGGSTTLGAASVYEWEINDVFGEPGQSVGWDLLQVWGELIFDATQQNPFVLKVIGLDETGEPGIVDNFDPSQNYEWLIASANSISGFDPTIIQVDASSFINSYPIPDPRRLSLKIDGANLFLVHQVPEPTSWILMSLGLGSVASRWRISCC